MVLRCFVHRVDVAVAILFVALELGASFLPVPRPGRQHTGSPDAVAALFASTTKSAEGQGEDGDKSTAIIEYDDFLPRPGPEWTATDVVNLCMRTLVEGAGGSGLEVCFDFSSDRCRAALGGSLDRFRQYSTNPVFGYMVNCDGWEVLSVGPIINGTVTRGDMQTVLVKAIHDHPRRRDGGEKQQVKGDDSRNFLWTLQKERRPPRQGCWVIHEVIYVKNAFELTL